MRITKREAKQHAAINFNLARMKHERARVAERYPEAELLGFATATLYLIRLPVLGVMAVRLETLELEEV